MTSPPTPSPPTTSPLSDAVSEVMTALSSKHPPQFSVEVMTERLIRCLAATVPGPVATSVVRCSPRNGTFESIAASDRIAAELDALQCRATQGPSLDAVTLLQPVVVADVRADHRWPVLAAAAARVDALRSVVSAQVMAPSFRGSLTMYSPQAGAFGGPDCGALTSVAAVVGLGLAADEHRRQADNLTTALATSRTIGVAIGVLMVRHQVTRERAFEAMVEISQRSQRKLRDLAEEIVRTGAAPEAVRP